MNCNVEISESKSFRRINQVLTVIQFLSRRIFSKEGHSAGNIVPNVLGILPRPEISIRGSSCKQF